MAKQTWAELGAYVRIGARHEQVILLSNSLPPYRVPLFQRMSSALPVLTVYVDTPVESDRGWAYDPADLRVRKTWGFSFPRSRTLDSGRDLHLSVLLPLQLIVHRPRAIISGELGMRSLASVLYCSFFSRRVTLVLWLCLSEHTERGRGGLRRRLRKYMLSHCDAVVVHSASAKRYVETLNSDVPISVAPQASGLPIADCVVDRVWCPSLSLVFVGSLAPRKNLEWLVEQLERWAVSRSCDVNLRVVGLADDDWERPLPEVRSGLKIDFSGFLSFERMSQAYDKADALIFPTLSDEWGLVVNESLGRGTPVIGSVHSAAVVELVTTGESGFKFDPEADDSLYVALDSFVVMRKTQSRSTVSDACLRDAGAASLERMAGAFVNAVKIGAK